MKKTIKQGNFEKTFKFVCSFCNCEFESDEFEIRNLVSDIGEDYFLVDRCPNCKILIYDKPAKAK